MRTKDIAAMPKKKEKFTAEQIGLVRAWIDQGAKWEGSVAKKITYNTNHWAFKTPASRTPERQRQEMAAHTHRQFHPRQTRRGKTQALPEADKITLLRRLSLDLIGLPPMPEEVDAFLADKSPMLTRNKSNALLASPHYGEKWGRTGSMPRVTRIPMVSRRTRRATFGSIAIGWSTRSIRICPTTNSSSNNSPAICCRIQQCHSRRHRRHWFPPQLHDQRGRRH
jgi:hypothetical protein